MDGDRYRMNERPAAPGCTATEELPLHEDVDLGAAPEADDLPLVPARLLVGLLAALAALGIAIRFVMPVNGDAAWYLYMAGRVLDGARPYVDVVDTNPPLIVMLSMATVLPARALGVSPLTVFPLE